LHAVLPGVPPDTLTMREFEPTLHITSSVVGQ